MSKPQYSLKRLTLTLLISSFVVVTAVSSLLATAHAPCQNLASAQSLEAAISTHQWQRGNDNVTALCNRNNQQINWVTWLFKGPESPQFHFVDLLELLSRQS
jgi:hypothetical protein